MSSFSIKILEASGRKGVERDVKRTEKLVGLRRKSCPSPYHRLSWCRRDSVWGRQGAETKSLTSLFLLNGAQRAIRPHVPSLEPSPVWQESGAVCLQGWA